MLILPTKAFAKDTVTITVSDASAQAGETAEMIVLVETESGVSGAGITAVYNKTAMTLTEIRHLASGMFFDDLERDSFSWLKGNNLSGTFELVALCFSIDASAGGDYTVEVKPIGDFAANITNQDASPVAATFVPGILSVVKEVVGEVEPPSTTEPDAPPTAPPDVSTTEKPDVPGTEDPKPDSTLDAEENPSKPPDVDEEKDPNVPEENEPQLSPSTPTTPTEEPEKGIGNIGLYIAVIAAAAVGFVAGTVRKKRK